MFWYFSYFFNFFLDLLKEVESSLRTNRDCLASLKCRTPCQNRHDYRLNHPPRKTRPKTTRVKARAYKSEDPHAILGPEKRKNERETVEEKEETADSQPCKRKRLTEVLKAPKPSPAKTDSCNPFHNRTQDRTKERENCTVLDLGISKDRE